MRYTLLLLVVVAGLAGCGGGVKEETISVPEQDPMVQVQATLSNYARGQPVTSEVTTYDYMVNKLREKDSAKADILKAGLDEIQKNPKNAKAKSKELLTKLGLEEKK